jgi:outer membrane protein assembly factor BamB
MKSLSPISRNFKLSFAPGLLILLAAIPCGAQQPPMPKFLDYHAFYSDFAFGPDGRVIAVVGGDTAVWDVASGRRVLSFACNPSRNAMAISPDSRYLAAAHEENLVIWDISTGKVVRRWTGIWPKAVAFSPDGRWLGTGWGSHGGDDLQIRSVATWEVVRTITGVPGKTPTKIVFSPDGALVVSTPELTTNQTKVWEVATGKVVREWTTPGVVLDVAISPDGLHLATAGVGAVDKGVVEIRNLATGELVHSISVHLSGNIRLAFTKDKRLAVAAMGPEVDRPTEVRLFDVASGRSLFTIEVRPGFGVDVSTEDRYLAVGTTRFRGRGAADVHCIALWELSTLRASKTAVWSYTPWFRGAEITASVDLAPPETQAAPPAPIMAAAQAQAPTPGALQAGATAPVVSVAAAEPMHAGKPGRTVAGTQAFQLEGAPTVQRLNSRPEGATYLQGPRKNWWYLQVSVKAKNASGDAVPIAFPGDTVYLSRGPETFPLQDVIWPGKKELAGVMKIVKNGELDLEGPGYTLHVGSGGGSEGAVLSLNPGATQELALLFQVPEDAKDAQLRLHGPGGLTFALAGTAGAAASPEVQPAATAFAGVSAMFRGNLARTGEGAGKPVERAPRLKWKFKGGEMVASPVIAGDVVYVCTIGFDWKLYALDLATGKARWSTVVGEVVASPAVAEGRVVVASSQQVLALDQAKGGVLWAKLYPKGTLIWGSPAVRGGLVFVASLTGGVDILDLATGESRGNWTAAGPISSSLAFSEDAVYFPTWNKEVTAWSLDSAAQRWNVNLYPDASRIRSMDSNVVSVGHVGLIPGSAVVGEAAVYAQKMPYEWGHRAGLVALDKGSGKTMWEFYPESSWDGKWRSGSGFERLSITTSEGESRWDLMPPGDRVSSAPALAEGTVVYGCIDGKIYAVNAGTGKQKWVFVTKYAVYSSPTITGGVVFVGSDDTNLYALDLKTGGELWRFKTKDVVRTTPATADGVVVFASRDGYVYALQE